MTRTEKYLKAHKSRSREYPEKISCYRPKGDY